MLSGLGIAIFGKEGLYPVAFIAERFKCCKIDHIELRLIHCTTKFGHIQASTAAF